MCKDRTFYASRHDEIEINMLIFTNFSFATLLFLPSSLYEKSQSCLEGSHKKSNQENEYNYQVVVYTKGGQEGLHKQGSRVSLEILEHKRVRNPCSER